MSTYPAVQLIPEDEQLQRARDTVTRLFPVDFQAFRQTEMNAQTFAVLLALTEANWTEAIILWDLMIYHRRSNKLESFKEISGRDFAKQYGQTHPRFTRAVESLVAQELIVRKPRVRNMAMLLRLDWEWLVRSVTEIPLDIYIPGVTFSYFTAPLPAGNAS